MTDTATAYFDPSELISFAETIDPSQVVETSDFSDFAITPVGSYVSNSRELASQAQTKPDGTVTIRLRFTGGLQSTNNGGKTYLNGKYPLAHTISSKLYALPDRPGLTSGLAQYLKAVGFETKGKSVGEMVALVAESLSLPIGVRIGRTDKGKKNEAANTWTNANLKTKDFETGRDGEGKPVYGVQVTRDGVTYDAKERIDGFFNVSK
jgi:hypothetical protein